MLKIEETGAVYHITELKAGQCKYPISGDVPRRIALCANLPFGEHFFCGEPTVDPANPKCVYCAAHHARCYKGVGKDWRSIETMMRATEQTMAYVAGKNRDRDTTPELPEMLEET